MHITTLALGSRSKQRLAKVRAKNEARESYFMLLGDWEYGKMWEMNIHTPDGLPNL
jgi:hypothetical protein